MEADRDVAGLDVDIATEEDIKLIVYMDDYMIPWSHKTNRLLFTVFETVRTIFDRAMIADLNIANRF